MELVSEPEYRPVMTYDIDVDVDVDVDVAIDEIHDRDGDYMLEDAHSALSAEVDRSAEIITDDVMQDGEDLLPYSQNELGHQDEELADAFDDEDKIISSLELHSIPVLEDYEAYSVTGDALLPASREESINNIQSDLSVLQKVSGTELDHTEEQVRDLEPQIPKAATQQQVHTEDQPTSKLDEAQLTDSFRSEQQLDESATYEAAQTNDGQLTEIERLDSEATKQVSGAITYTHPVIVSYEESELSMFPPSTEDASDTYLLEDESLAAGSMCELFSAIRAVLADSISEDDELEISCESLGLSLSEDSSHASNVSLRRLLDLHVQLCRQDGIETPDALYIVLRTRAAFSRRLDQLTEAAAKGKGISELQPWTNEGGDEGDNSYMEEASLDSNGGSNVAVYTNDHGSTGDLESAVEGADPTDGGADGTEISHHEASQIESTQIESTPVQEANKEATSDGKGTEQTTGEGAGDDSWTQPERQMHPEAQENRPVEGDTEQSYENPLDEEYEPGFEIEEAEQLEFADAGNNVINFDETAADNTSNAPGSHDSSTLQGDDADLVTDVASEVIGTYDVALVDEGAGVQSGSVSFQDEAEEAYTLDGPSYESEQQDMSATERSEVVLVDTTIDPGPDVDANDIDGSTAYHEYADATDHDNKRSIDSDDDVAPITGNENYVAQSHHEDQTLGGLMEDAETSAATLKESNKLDAGTEVEEEEGEGGGEAEDEREVLDGAQATEGEPLTYEESGHEVSPVHIDWVAQEKGPVADVGNSYDAYNELNIEEDTEEVDFEDHTQNHEAEPGHINGSDGASVVSIDETGKKRSLLEREDGETDEHDDYDNPDLKRMRSS